MHRRRGVWPQRARRNPELRSRLVRSPELCAGRRGLRVRAAHALQRGRRRVPGRLLHALGVSGRQRRVSVRRWWLRRRPGLPTRRDLCRRDRSTGRALLRRRHLRTGQPLPGRSLPTLPAGLAGVRLRRRRGLPRWPGVHGRALRPRTPPGRAPPRRSALLHALPDRPDPRTRLPVGRPDGRLRGRPGVHRRHLPTAGRAAPPRRLRPGRWVRRRAPVPRRDLLPGRTPGVRPAGRLPRRRGLPGGPLLPGRAGHLPAGRRLPHPPGLPGRAVLLQLPGRQRLQRPQGLLPACMPVAVPHRRRPLPGGHGLPQRRRRHGGVHACGRGHRGPGPGQRAQHLQPAQDGARVLPGAHLGLRRAHQQRRQAAHLSSAQALHDCVPRRRRGGPGGRPPEALRRQPS